MVYKLTADKMLEFINLQPSISARQLAMNFQVTSRTIENHIAKLKQSGRLSQVGGARGGHWQVNYQPNTL